MSVLQMCALCESIGRGVHFNPYASIGRQVHETFKCMVLHACVHTYLLQRCLASQVLPSRRALHSRHRVASFEALCKSNSCLVRLVTSR